MKLIMDDIIFSKACEIYAIMDNEIYDFKNKDINEQIANIMRYVEAIMQYNDSLNHDFINKVFNNCYIARDNVRYPYMNGESELGYVEELREAYAFAMIESVIKDFNEYYKK